MAAGLLPCHGTSLAVQFAGVCVVVFPLLVIFLASAAIATGRR
jgi:hypothetical protein